MLVRVFKMPVFSGGFRFGGGKPETFIEVDWFRDDPWAADDEKRPRYDTPEGRAAVAAFIKGKNYYVPDCAYLILHPLHPFTIGYSAP